MQLQTEKNEHTEGIYLFLSLNILSALHSGTIYCISTTYSKAALYTMHNHSSYLKLNRLILRGFESGPLDCQTPQSWQRRTCLNDLLSEEVFCSCVSTELLPAGETAAAVMGIDFCDSTQAANFQLWWDKWCLSASPHSAASTYKYWQETDTELMMQ